MMRKKYRYAFAKKSPAQDGVVSTIVGGLAVLLFFAAVILSAASKGEAGAAAGGLGVFSMLLSVYGFVLGMRSFKEQDKNYRYSIIGAMGNGIFAVCQLGIVLAAM